MRNLKLVKHNRYQDERLDKARLICVDSDKCIYFLSEDGIHKLDVISNKLQCNVITEGLIPINNENAVIGIAYLFIDQSICLATSSGDILMFSTVSGELECVGTVEYGIEAMSWSPDQEIVVIVTGNNSMILMTRDFDAICESPIHSENFGENQPVSIGWGNKETQFHGSEGKAAAKSKPQLEQKVFPFDDRKTRISWRGDGQFFVINYVMPDMEMRLLRVWNREGVLQYSSEPLCGVEQALHWQPSGSMIASTLRKPNKHELIFFEKNCLSHGGFSLPFESKQIKVNEVMWNCESSMLAIWAEDLHSDNVSLGDHLNHLDVKCYLQIWIMNNFHWYLKQSFASSPLTFSYIRTIFWDPENANQLHVLCSGGLYFNFVWSWDINCSRGTMASDSGIVAVIDGAQLLMTPFRSLVVPPPLSAFTFHLPKAINHILNAPHSQSNDIIVITEDNNLAVFSEDHSYSYCDTDAVNMSAAGGNGFKPHLIPHRLKGIYELLWSQDFELPHFSMFHHWIWVNSSFLFFTYTSQRNNDSILVQVCCDTDPTNSKHFKIKKCISLDGQVILTAALPNETGVAIELSDGSIFKHCCDSDMIDPWLKQDGSNLKLPRPCYEMRIVCINSKDYVLSLSDTCCLYINDFELASNCTSFYFVNEFLLFTTQTHELHCLTKHLLQEDFTNIKKKSAMIEQLRNLERGSRIVTVVPNDTKVVFQMPRGNLETIHPRPLVLKLSWQYLNDLRYKEVLLLMRKHRINMNLIFDHSPNLFLSNVDKFLKQVDDINWINLFLSSLQQEDVTSTLYKAAYMAMENDRNMLSKWNNSQNKVDLICDVMLRVMENLDVNRYFLGILTAHAKKTKPELDIALQRIIALKASNSSVNSNGITSDAALKHLLYLVDVNDLFNVALGTYDFDIVVLVAEKSQKDPKEYLPFLNGLQKLEPNYRKYSIDKYLKRNSKALYHLSKCGDEHFDECLTFVHSHNLYSEALNLFTKGSHHYQRLLDAFGDHLLGKHDYEEAGIMFTKGSMFEKALFAFKKSGNWMQGFSAAFKMDYSSGDIITLAREYAGLLKSSNNFVDASYVLEAYAMDHEESIATLVEGCEWERSLMMMHKYQRLDMAESHLFPALMDNCSNISSILATSKSTFERHKKRLIIVQTEKQAKISQINDDADDCFSYEADLYSDGSTLTGMVSTVLSSASGSRFTSRTSRNKRKQNRKKVNLKEGSLFEDIALLEALTLIIKQTDEMKADCGGLIRALLLHGFEREATKLQLQLDEFMKYILSSKSEIWPMKEERQEADEIVKVGPLSTVNSILSATRQSFKEKRNVPVEYQLFLHPPSLNHDVRWKMESLKHQP